MSEGKHTPGPWEADGNSEHGYNVLAKKDAGGTDWVELATHIEKKADADLFALAPAMLEALEEAVDSWGSHVDWFANWYPKVTALVAKARRES